MPLALATPRPASRRGIDATPDRGKAVENWESSPPGRLTAPAGAIILLPACAIVKDNPFSLDCLRCTVLHERVFLQARGQRRSEWPTEK
jgi:hypothetical protein